MIPSAYAWSWGGVWDGVKSTVGFLIPYEDFITIGQQLMYLVNQDWENFDPTALAFASLGAATIIPVAKPLKVVLGPLKKVVDGMRHFPAARHFAGMIGTAVKAGISGKTDKIANLLPFILIAIELYDDPEVFTFIMNAVESEDDLWVWVEYIAEVVAIEGGLDTLAYVNNIDSTNTQLVSNPLGFVVKSAQAKSKKAIAEIFIKRIKEVTKSIDAPDAKEVSKVLRKIFMDQDLKKIAASGTSALRMFAAVGGKRIVNFMNNSKSWRVNRYLVLFALVYLTEEYDAGRLELSSDSHLSTLVSNLFSKNKSNYNGATFEIVQAAYFHALNQAASTTFPKVTGLNAERGANWLVNEEKENTYKRQVDIVLEHSDGKEEWVELKSYAKSTIGSSVKPKDKAFSGSRVFREFFHDYRLNDEFITGEDAYQRKIRTVGTNTINPNKTFTWYFQDFDIPKGVGNTGKPPSQTQVNNLIKKLCNRPEDVSEKDYEYNFYNKDEGKVKSKCKTEAGRQVTLRNTRSYFNKVLQAIGSDFALAIKNELAGVD